MAVKHFITKGLAGFGSAPFIVTKGLGPYSTISGPTEAAHIKHRPRTSKLPARRQTSSLKDR